MPLVVCPTPIGNLEDVTLRALRELGDADLVLCEDTRRTRILLDRHGIRARTLSFHRHNEASRAAEVLPRLEAGERIALASDAGLPGVSDPGARLVAAVLEAEPDGSSIDRLGRAFAGMTELDVVAATEDTLLGAWGVARGVHLPDLL